MIPADAVEDNAILFEEIKPLLDQLGIHPKEFIDAIKEKKLKGYHSWTGENYFRLEEIEAWWNERCQARARLS